MPDTDYRLPTSVRPTHYELAIKTDLAASPPAFTGEVTITLEVVEDTAAVVFHVHSSLSITHLAISAGVVHEVPLSAVSKDEDKERVSIDLASLGAGGGLKKGQESKLFVRWEGELNGNMMGYYRSNSDPDKSGKRLM